MVGEQRSLFNINRPSEEEVSGWAAGATYVETILEVLGY